MFRRIVTQQVRAFSVAPVRIDCPNAPAAVGPYSHAISANGMIYVSGQLPLDAKTMKFVSDTDVALQTRQCLVNMASILETAGSSMDKVCKTTILLTDMADFPAVNTVYAEFFKATLPARATFAVKALPLGSKVEIECVALQ